MDKTFIKTVTKTKGEDTKDVEIFLTNWIFKNNSVKTTFYTTVKNLRAECTLITFPLR